MPKIRAGCDPGEVYVTSSSDGSLIVTFRGRTCGDKFGHDLAVVRDINGDIHDDLIIGAPGDIAPVNGYDRFGHAFVFLGPFRDTEPLEISAENADFTFFSPRPEIYDFGERVSPVSDLDSDDIPELRIRGYSEVEPGVEQEHTFIVSGVDGFPLYEIIGYDPFDPWATQPGDVDGDGDVDQLDLDLIWENRGITEGATVYDGDVDGDGDVDTDDWNFADALYGSDMFASLAGIGDPTTGGGTGGGGGGSGGDPGTGGPWDCPEPSPPGFSILYNCWNYEMCLPDNVEPLCETPICQAWCGFDLVGPLPWSIPVDPMQVSEIQAVNGLQLDEVTWQAIEGGHRIEVLDPDDGSGQTLSFLPFLPGPVTIRASNSVCSYNCEEEVSFTITLEPSDDDTDGDGIPDYAEVCLGYDPYDSDSTPDPENDFDNDGLPDVVECELGTDPFHYDSDEDGLPDGWEVEHDFDPLDGDTDGDGVEDGEQDNDDDGLPNSGEWPSGLDPYDSDTDGDGTSDSDEIEQGSNPNDASDNGEIDPMDVAEIYIGIGTGGNGQYGSYDNRWMINVGYITVVMPDYGVSGGAYRKIRIGESYDITVDYLGTDPDFVELWGGPYYQYQAQISCHDGLPPLLIGCAGWIEDPDGLLPVASSDDCCEEVEPPPSCCEDFSYPYNGCCNPATGKTATLWLPKLRLKSVTYGGELHTVTRDTTGQAYTEPHWLDANGDKDVDDPGDNQNPIAMTRDHPLEIEEVRFTFEPSDMPTEDLLVTGSNFYNSIISESVSVQGGEAVATDFPPALDNSVLDTVQRINFGMSWSFQIGDLWYCDEKYNTNTLYVTWNDPILGNTQLYETLLFIGCLNAAGFGGSMPPSPAAVQAVVDAIWSEFADLHVWRAEDFHQLTYYQEWNCVNLTTGSLIQNGDGQCGAWVKLFLDCLKVQGIDFPNEYVLFEQIEGGAPFGFMVKDWHFHTQGSSGHPEYPYLNIPGEPFIDWMAPNDQYFYNWQYDQVADLIGNAGQGTSDPASLFNNHQVAFINGTYYDPSYGLTYTSLADIDNSAIKGYYSEMEDWLLDEGAVGYDYNEDGDMTDVHILPNVTIIKQNPPGNQLIHHPSSPSDY